MKKIRFGDARLGFVDADGTPCTTSPRNGRSCPASSLTAASPSITIRARTQSGPLWSGGAIGCLPIPSAGPMRVRTCIRCCRLARRTGLSLSDIWRPCSRRYHWLRPPMITRRCCLGISRCRLRNAARAQSLRRSHPSRHCKARFNDRLRLFADTVGGAHASANLYSLLQTCKANRVDPYRYLAALFTALPMAQTADDYEALLPWNIALPPA